MGIQINGTNDTISGNDGAFQLQSALFVSSSNNIGIGVTNPSASVNLEILGNSEQLRLRTTNDVSVTNSTVFLRLNDVNGSAAYFGFGGNSNSLDIFNYKSGPLRFATNNVERARFDSSGNLGIGTINPRFQLETTGPILINSSGAGTIRQYGQYLVDYLIGAFNDPGSYPEYLLLGRINSADEFKMIGNIYGNRGAGGERNSFFNICCSKTSLPSTSYAVGGRIGSASYNLVTLTYSGNSWLALQSTSASITGGLVLAFTGTIYHSHTSTSWSHKDFYGFQSIPNSSVSGVSTVTSV